jgi:curved DNA-binding protein CbpA
MAFSGQDSTHYDLLGIRPDATPDEVKRAYRRKVLELHPDTTRGADGKLADAEAFQRVRLAYQVLSDAAERLRYDATTGLGPARRPIYHRSFSNLFDSLFAGLRTAVRSTAELSADLGARADERRKAG